MIYLIKSAAIINKSTDELGLILKIGYTKDDGKKSRFDCYITENPTIEVLYLIPEGNEQDEKNLHYYFKDYLLYGNEWFSYNMVIIEFFKNHTTKESLKELNTFISKNKQRILKKEHKEHMEINTLKYINRVIYELGFSRELLINLTDIVENNTQEYIDKYFTETYPNIDFEKPREIDNEVANIIESLDLLPYFNLKMKYLYNLNMSEDLAKRLFDTISDTTFKKYYYSISREVAGTLHYQKGALEKEFNRLNSISTTINIDKLPDEVYSNFSEGCKYSKSYIKDKLKEIYDKLGYSKTAKANDLEEYFEIKLCKVVDSSGKRDNGFELIKKRVD